MKYLSPVRAEAADVADMGTIVWRWVWSELGGTKRGRQFARPRRVGPQEQA
jgi:hypothetical protein